MVRYGSRTDVFRDPPAAHRPRGRGEFTWRHAPATRRDRNAQLDHVPVFTGEIRDLLPRLRDFDPGDLAIGPAPRASPDHLLAVPPPIDIIDDHGTSTSRPRNPPGPFDTPNHGQHSDPRIASRVGVPAALTLARRPDIGPRRHVTAARNPIGGPARPTIPGRDTNRLIALLGHLNPKTHSA